jgi:cytochrome c oxidase subunit IV
MSEMTETEHRVDQPHGHPTEGQYLIVALVLAILTLAEVGVYYLKSLPDDALIGMLAVLAIVKFSMVVLYFMHLKFDSRIFRRFFVTGLVLALIVYMIVLNTFHVFAGGIPRA